MGVCINTGAYTQKRSQCCPHTSAFCVWIWAYMRSLHGHLVFPQSIRFIPSPFSGPCGAESRQRGWLPGPFLTRLPEALGWYMLSGSRQVTVSCTLPGEKKTHLGAVTYKKYTKVAWDTSSGTITHRVKTHGGVGNPQSNTHHK